MEDDRQRAHRPTNERIHAFLDGELSPRALARHERVEVERLKEAIDDALRPLREAPSPDVSAAVMSRIERIERERAVRSWSRRLRAAARRAVEWFWTPRPVRVRPAWALASVAVLGLGLGLLAVGQIGSGTAAATTANAGTDAQVLWVQFRLEAPDARSVELAGTFSDWEPRHELVETRPGHWTALVPLRPGVHEYSFVVDGERWIADPHAPRVDDGFGGSNSRIGLLTPENGRSS